MRRNLRTGIILLTIGAFISASQAAFARPAGQDEQEPVESCFSEEGMLDLSGMSSAGPDIPSMSFGAADTLQTHEIELEDESGKGTNYKAYIGLAIAAAFVGYALYIMLIPEDEEEETEPPGKDPAGTLISIPF